MKLTDAETRGLDEFIAAALALLGHMRSGNYGPVLTARVERLRVAYNELNPKLRNATQ